MKLYVDILSQPCRACLIFTRLNELPVNEVLMRISSKQHRSEEFLAANPLGLLPFLQDEEFGLPESASILRYLTMKYEDVVEDHWYPDACRSQATVDALLHWYHLNIRAAVAGLTTEYMKSGSSGNEPNEHEIWRSKQILNKALKTLENYYLKDSVFCSIPSTKSDVGTKPSIADLLISCELEQLVLLWRFPNVEAHLRLLPKFAEYPRIAKYLKSIEHYCAPHYGIVHKTLRKISNHHVARL